LFLRPKGGRHIRDFSILSQRVLGSPFLYVKIAEVS
jgi:hypothetical protein